VGGIALQDFAVKHTLNLERWQNFSTECDVVLSSTWYYAKISLCLGRRASAAPTIDWFYPASRGRNKKCRKHL
jgi:hypothetical protein